LERYRFFIAVTSSYDERAKRRIALKATFISALILVFFVLAGEVILSAMDIPLSAFQIAGGIVLFLFALTMIFGDSKPEQEVKPATDEGDAAVFPLAVPSIDRIAFVGRTMLGTNADNASKYVPKLPEPSGAVTNNATTTARIVRRFI